MHTVTFTLSDQQLRDIINSASCYYWLQQDCWECLNQKGDFRILVDQIEGQSVINKRIEPRTIATGLQKMVSCAEYSRTLTTVLRECMSSDRCYADGPTCDVVLQFAVFGRVVFQ